MLVLLPVLLLMLLLVLLLLLLVLVLLLVLLLVVLLLLEARGRTAVLEASKLGGQYPGAENKDLRAVKFKTEISARCAMVFPVVSVSGAGCCIYDPTPVSRRLASHLDEHP